MSEETKVWTPIIIDGENTTPEEWMRKNATEDQLIQNWNTLELHGDIACDSEWLQMFHASILAKGLTYAICESPTP